MTNSLLSKLAIEIVCVPSKNVDVLSLCSFSRGYIHDLLLQSLIIMLNIPILVDSVQTLALSTSRDCLNQVFSNYVDLGKLEYFTSLN